MKMMAILAMSALAATGAQAQSTPDYVRVSGPPNGRTGVDQDSVVYWNTAQVQRDGDQVEVELRYVTQSLGTTRPMSSSRRYRISCEWGVQSFRHTSEDGRGEVWSVPRFISADMLVSTANQACGFVAGPDDVPRFSSDEAAYEDGVKRLGFVSLEAAMRLPEGQPFERSGPFYTVAPTGDEAGRYELVYGPDRDHRAVFLKRPDSSAPGTAVEGHSIWLMGVGQPTQARSYAMRDFRADCSARTIAVASVRSWPTADSVRAPGAEASGPTALLSLPPAEGTASAALLGVACSEPADDGVVAASIDQVVAFAETPGEDPAFAVLSQQKINHDDMRWTRAPDAAAVSAAYPQGALQPGETGLTTVACVVTREYALTACAPTYHSPVDRGLQEAHMTLIGQYAPARASVVGGGTIGRRVEFSIRWSPDGSAPEPQMIPAEDMIWLREPSRADVQRSRRERGRAAAFMTCDITADHHLANCGRRLWTGDNGRSLSDAMTALAPLFVAGPTTRSGEPTAGRKIRVVLRSDR